MTSGESWVAGCGPLGTRGLEGTLITVGGPVGNSFAETGSPYSSVLGLIFLSTAPKVQPV